MNQGKRVLALAGALAVADGPVLLIDADLRKPTLHRFFGLGARPGLATLLQSFARVAQSGGREESASEQKAMETIVQQSHRLIDQAVSLDSRNSTMAAMLSISAKSSTSM